MKSLGDLLARMGAAVIDDAAAAELDRAVEAGKRYEQRIARAAALQRDHVPIDAAVEDLLLDGGAGLKPSKALRAVRGWLAQGKEPFIVLSGRTGCGKSVAAAHAVAESQSGVWRTAEQLCRVFNASFGDQYEDQEHVVTCGLLVADDIGTELESSRARMASVLIELLEKRRRRGQRTVITTNLNRTDFIARYSSERLLSRLDPNAKIVAWIEANDSDMRRNK